MEAAVVIIIYGKADTPALCCLLQLYATVSAFTDSRVASILSIPLAWIITIFASSSPASKLDTYATLADISHFSNVSHDRPSISPHGWTVNGYSATRTNGIS